MARPTPTRQLSRESFGALALTLLCVPALIFSVYLSLLKFRATYLCDPLIRNTCGESCDLVLVDSHSLLFGLPLTVYATGFYFVLLLIAFAVAGWPRYFVPATRVLLSLLASAGLLVALGLAAYARLSLGTVCHFCAVLYLANLGIYFAARLIHPPGLVRTLFVRPRRPALLTAFVWWSAGGAMLALTIGQGRVYEHHAAVAVRDGEVSCSEVAPELPGSTLKVPSEGPPGVLVALFVDFACPHCRDEFTSWRDLQAENREFMQLEVFHFPQDRECGHKADNFASRTHMSCRAARAAECMSGSASAVELVERLFALQDESSPYFSEDGLARLGRELSAADLTACIVSPEIDRRVREHVTYALDTDLRGPPAALIFPMLEGRPSGPGRLVRGGGHDREALRRLIESARPHTEVIQ